MTTLSYAPSTLQLPDQGDCVRLDIDEQTYQVIGVDERHNRCWVRRWPLERQGSEVFEISLQHVQPQCP